MKNILIKNIKGLVGVLEHNSKALRGSQLLDLQTIENAFLAIEDGKIAYYGSMDEMQGITDWRNLEIIDAEGKFVMPAFCDSHTHLVFAQSRESEFSQHE